MDVSRFYGYVLQEEVRPGSSPVCIVAGTLVASGEWDLEKSDKGRIAEELIEQWASFQMALFGQTEISNRGIPTLFALKVRQYVHVIGEDRLIHCEVAGAINGLVEFFQVERKRIPGEILTEAARLETDRFATSG